MQVILVLEPLSDRFHLRLDAGHTQPRGLRLLGPPLPPARYRLDTLPQLEVLVQERFPLLMPPLEARVRLGERRLRPLSVGPPIRLLGRLVDDDAPRLLRTLHALVRGHCCPECTLAGAVGVAGERAGALPQRGEFYTERSGGRRRLTPADGQCRLPLLYLLAGHLSALILHAARGERG